MRKSSISFLPSWKIWSESRSWKAGPSSVWNGCVMPWAIPFTHATTARRSKGKESSVDIAPLRSTGMNSSERSTDLRFSSPGQSKAAGMDFALSFSRVLPIHLRPGPWW